MRQGFSLQPQSKESEEMNSATNENQQKKGK
jgi:hypothetical protein